MGVKTFAQFDGSEVRLKFQSPTPVGTLAWLPKAQGGARMTEHGICDQCKDRNNPVTAQNGGTLSRITGAQKVWIADVHTKCKDEWLNQHGAADFSGLPPAKSA